MDARDWIEAFDGSVYGLAVTGALRRTRQFVVPIRKRCRYVRLTQTGHDDEMFWSIAELGVETVLPEGR